MFQLTLQTITTSRACALVYSNNVLSTTHTRNDLIRSSWDIHIFLYVLDVYYINLLITNIALESSINIL